MDPYDTLIGMQAPPADDDLFEQQLSGRIAERQLASFGQGLGSQFELQRNAVLADMAYRGRTAEEEILKRHEQGALDPAHEWKVDIIKEARQEEQDRDIVAKLAKGELVIGDEDLFQLKENASARARYGSSKELSPEQKDYLIAQTLADDTRIRRSATPPPPEQIAKSPHTMKRKLIDELPPYMQKMGWQYDAENGTLQLPRGYTNERATFINSLLLDKTGDTPTFTPERAMQMANAVFGTVQPDGTVGTTQTAPENRPTGMPSGPVGGGMPQVLIGNEMGMSRQKRALRRFLGPEDFQKYGHLLWRPDRRGGFVLDPTAAAMEKAEEDRKIKQKKEQQKDTEKAEKKAETDEQKRLKANKDRKMAWAKQTINDYNLFQKQLAADNALLPKDREYDYSDEEIANWEKAAGQARLILGGHWEGGVAKKRFRFDPATGQIVPVE